MQTYIKRKTKLLMRGFTLVELLAVIVILAIILAIAIPAISSLVENSKKEAFKASAKMIVKAIDYKKLDEPTFDVSAINETTAGELLGIDTTSISTLSVTLVNGKPSVSITGTGQWEGLTAQGTFNTIVVTDTPIDPSYAYYSEIEGVNVPLLAAGMTPIKWVNGVETETTIDDEAWYDYTSKLWANAKTQDGSYWVWIPRYIYKIPTVFWHKSTAGEIAIQFSKGTDDDWNRAVIGNLSLAGTADASNNTWTAHPTFTFGTKELTGIWVSKFEASNNGGKVASKPNVKSWTNINVATMFNNSRSMETDATYGWGTSGTNLDTHMIKNTEWGAVAYLSHSKYGKNSQVWVNNINSDLAMASGPTITGCAGSTYFANMVRSATCPVGNTYETATGVNASTSGNITGIYDMSGGSWEYVMGNLDNLPASSGLTMATIQDQYIDKYSSSNNYGYNNSTYGDAYYETSSEAFVNNTTGSSSGGWYTDGTSAPYSANPWFMRGGSYGSSMGAGLFGFFRDSGIAFTSYGFRSVVLVLLSE